MEGFNAATLGSIGSVETPAVADNIIIREDSNIKIMPVTSMKKIELLKKGATNDKAESVDDYVPSMSKNSKSLPPKDMSRWQVRTRSRQVERMLKDEQANQDFYHRPSYVYQSDRRNILVQ